MWNLRENVCKIRQIGNFFTDLSLSIDYRLIYKLYINISKLYKVIGYVVIKVFKMSGDFDFNNGEKYNRFHIFNNIIILV